MPISGSRFPLQLMAVLNDDLSPDIVTWLPEGHGFTILDKKRFESEVMPQYFKESRYTSFTKRLRRWGFASQQPQPHNPKQVMYFHPSFHRESPVRCLNMCPKRPQNGHTSTSNNAVPEATTSMQDKSAVIPAPGVSSASGGSPNAGVRYIAPQSFQMRRSGYAHQQQCIPTPMGGDARMSPSFHDHDSQGMDEAEKYRADYEESLKRIYIRHQTELAKEMMMSRITMEHLMMRSQQRYCNRMRREEEPVQPVTKGQH
mmetsp:Transcript_22311/g.32613  ORF Transcript_22311/g.32613 Transcript_22311/m.32613 type:complete len:258 (-) Transcript_22311:152-925(-)